MVDPWQDCVRLYSDHFSERMSERHLPDNQVSLALKEGKRIQEQGDNYSVRWKKWTIKVTHGNCFLTLETAFRT